MRVVLIDGYGCLFRAFFGIPPMVRDDGMPIAAVFGVVRLWERIWRTFEPTHWAMILDTGQPTWRHAMFPEYKSHRQPTPPELIPQFALMEAACAAFGMPSVRVSGQEADDVIATYAQKACQHMASVQRNASVPRYFHQESVDLQDTLWDIAEPAPPKTPEKISVIVISCDKDLGQLVNEHVQLWDPFKRQFMDHTYFLEKFGVTPLQMGDFLSLMGDASDNIPGIPSVGPKKAAMLLQQFGSFDGIYHNIHDVFPIKLREQLSTHREQGEISRRLVALSSELPVPDWAALRCTGWPMQQYQKFLKTHHWDTPTPELLGA